MSPRGADTLPAAAAPDAAPRSMASLAHTPCRNRLSPCGSGFASQASPAKDPRPFQCRPALRHVPDSAAVIVRCRTLSRNRIVIGGRRESATAPLASRAIETGISKRSKYRENWSGRRDSNPRPQPWQFARGTFARLSGHSLRPAKTLRIIGKIANTGRRWYPHLRHILIRKAYEVSNFGPSGVKSKQIFCLPTKVLKRCQKSPRAW